MPTAVSPTSSTRDGIFDASLIVTAKRDGDGYLGAMTFDVRAA